MGNVPLIVNENQGDRFLIPEISPHLDPESPGNHQDGDSDSFLSVGSSFSLSTTEWHERTQKIKNGDVDDGGRDTSRPYLLHRKADGGQRPLPPLILEGELVTTAFDGQRSSNHKSGGRRF